MFHHYAGVMSRNGDHVVPVACETQRPLPPTWSGENISVFPTYNLQAQRLSPFLSTPPGMLSSLSVNFY